MASGREGLLTRLEEGAQGQNLTNGILPKAHQLVGKQVSILYLTPNQCF